MEVNFNLGFNEDAIVKLQKDLNHLLTHLDSQNVKKLYTEYCEIKSNEGVMVLDGPIMKMYGSTDLAAMRLFLGYDSTNYFPSTGTGQFVFKLFNTCGDETISLNSAGDAVFKGDINTGHDVYIGNNMFFSSQGSTTLKGLYFNTTTPVQLTSNNLYPYADGSSDSKTGMNFAAHHNTMHIVSSGYADLMAFNRVFLGVNSDTNYIAAQAIVIHSGVDPDGTSTERGIYLAGSSGVIRIYNSESGVYMTPTSGIEIGSALDGFFYGQGQSIWLSSDFIRIQSTKQVIIGTTAENVYIGDNVADNKVAIKGYVNDLTRTYVKPSLETVTTNVLQDDNAFVNMTIAAGELYMVDANLYFTGSSVVDVNVLWVLSLGATWQIGSTYYSARLGHGIGASAVSVQDGQYVRMSGLNLGDYPNTVYSYGIQGGGSWGSAVIERFLVRSSSTGYGLIKLQWCCSAAGSTGIILREGSFITITRVQEM